MSTLPHDLEQTVANALSRIEQLERAREAELAAAPRRYLVERQHSWRRQLCIKGRNMTVAQLMGAMRANGLTAEQTADAYDLPLEAVHEAIHYARQHAELLALEANEERRRLIENGYRVKSITSQAVTTR